MDGDLDYLQPGFDPARLTVPKLRSLLLEYNVHYPSSAKKPQLIDLFNNNIAPQARKILAARKRTKPSARGIKDIPASQASVADDDEEVVAPPKPSAKRSGTRATSGFNGAEDGVAEPPKRGPGRPRRVTPAPEQDTIEIQPKSSRNRSSSRHGRSTDVEAVVDEKPARRRSRKSAATPSVKPEDDLVALFPQDADSPFTSDNPFQSGSSPLQEPQQESRERRRKTTGPDERKEKRKSSEYRRRTDGAVAPTPKTFEMRVSRPKKEQPYVMDAGEEFTPEEQLDLVRERARTGELDILPPRRVARSSKGGSAAKTGAGFMFLALLGGLATIWTKEKFKVGYCGIGEPSNHLAGVELPDWAKVLQPHCEPCPPHAICSAHLQTSCETDFVLKHHPLSLGGFLPFPPTCEPDSEKARRVKAVSERAIDELRQRKAAVECGELVDESGKPVSSPAITEADLKEILSAQKKSRMSEEEFDELWDSALEDLPNREEIVVGSDGNGGSRTFATTSLAKLSYSCLVRRSIREALVRYLGQIVIIAIVILSGGYARHSITSGRETEERARQLASYALDRLANQASWHAHDAQAFPEAYIGMGHLRDDILRDEFSASRRVKLWHKVQKKVEQNSNVRPMNREGRSGDYGRVWEWIGPIGALEDGGSGNRRKSARFSLPASIESAPNSSPLARPGDSSVETRIWDESRPIY